LKEERVLRTETNTFGAVQASALFSENQLLEAFQGWVLPGPPTFHAQLVCEEPNQRLGRLNY
jgi:hypothetical protein